MNQKQTHIHHIYSVVLFRNSRPLTLNYLLITKVIFEFNSSLKLQYFLLSHKIAIYVQNKLLLIENRLHWNLGIVRLVFLRSPLSQENAN